MKIDNLKLYNIASIFRSPVFWFAILVDYLLKIGLTEASIFNVIAWYSIVIVISELPTGIIGDRYSHKLSILLGGLITAVSIFGLSFDLDLWYYYVILTGAGIGTSLISGSDLALLHNISDNFDTDYKNNKIMIIVTQLIGIISGGFLYVINNKLPVILTSICFILSTIAIFLINMSKEKLVQSKSQKVTAQMVEIKNEIFTTKKLQSIIVIIIISSGFFSSFKWFLNPLYIIWGIPLAWYGLITGFSELFKAVGVWGSKHFLIKPKYVIYIIGILLGCTIFISQQFIALLFMYLSFSAWGFLDAEMVVKLNKTIKSKNRAALNSLSSLFLRLFSSAILIYSGFISKYTSIQFNILIIITTLYILSIFVYFFFRTNGPVARHKLNNI